MSYCNPSISNNGPLCVGIYGCSDCVWICDRVGICECMCISRYTSSAMIYIEICKHLLVFSVCVVIQVCKTNVQDISYDDINNLNSQTLFLECLPQPE